MSRADEFRKLRQHAWYGRTFLKLKQSDIEFAIQWCNDNDFLDVDLFERAAARLWLDAPEKPRNHNLIVELITAANIIFENSKQPKKGD